MRRTRDDLIAEIKTARDEARIKANAYKGLTIKKYDYWRAVATALAYDKARTMFMRGTERDIPEMAADALANFEWARDSDTSEGTLAIMDGRRAALASVAEWMNGEESDR